LPFNRLDIELRLGRSQKLRFHSELIVSPTLDVVFAPTFQLQPLSRTHFQLNTADSDPGTLLFFAKIRYPLGV